MCEDRSKRQSAVELKRYFNNEKSNLWLSETSEQNVQNAAGQSPRPIGWDVQRIKFFTSRASVAINVDDNCRRANSLRWLMNKFSARVTTLRVSMAAPLRVTVSDNDENKFNVIYNEVKLFICSQTGTIVKVSIRINRSALGRLLRRNSCRYCRLISTLTQIPMDKTWRGSRAWLGWANEWRRFGFKIVEHARKSTNVHAMEIDHPYKPSSPSFHLTCA